ncbi:hypothetical protein [Microbacterium oxydans]|uniref:hypothetical protein n=1 Tax=Microbacterium oxydans TaxID=82380 RepID=UPI000B80CFE6|nr:hypothetical protein [Microbacterium oxydans]
MISPTPSFRSFARVAALTSALLLLAGCTPEPLPSPTPTPAFASEDEAFAAAEATYREYTDASNATDLRDARSFEPLYGWLRGEALSAAKDNYSDFYANGMSRTGETTFDSFSPVSYDGEIVTARLCLDVSDVELLDAYGVSAVPADRPPRQSLEVQFTRAMTSSALAISSTISTTAIEC